MILAAFAAAACQRTTPSAVPASLPPAPAPVPVSPPSAHAPIDLKTPLTTAQRRWIDSTLGTLSVRERVAQMVFVWALGDYTSTRDSAYLALRDVIRREGVGGFTMSLGSPVEVAVKIADLQRHARVPLLVASDVEPSLGRLQGGVFLPYTMTGGSATVIPTAMAIGATRDTALARRAGAVIGREARATGITVAFAPTVDVNNNPANPVINTRSFGADPGLVARMAAAFVHGVQDAGAVATAKHFPGHGDTDVDSHAGLPVIRADWSRLDSLELVPFRAAVDEGVAGVMSAHIALPAVAGDSTPATLVPAVLTGVLRDSLGFEGVAFTDALRMQAIGRGYGPGEAALLAVRAGADVLLGPEDAVTVIDVVTAAVERGEIPVERIDRSVRRLLELKARTGVAFDAEPSIDALRAIVGAPEHWAVAREIAERAVTLPYDSARLVPLAEGARPRVIVYAPETELVSGRTFVAELQRGGAQPRLTRIGPRTVRPSIDSLVAAGGTRDTFVVVTAVRRFEGEGATALDAGAAAWIDSLAARAPVVLVALGNPYVVRQLPHVGTTLLTYSIDPSSERAAAMALLGRQPITGRLPVSLGPALPIGRGIQMNATRPATPVPAPSAEMAAAIRDTLQRILDRAVRDSAFPGAIAVVGTRAGPLATAAAGRIDWAAEAQPPDESTLWDLASLTKVVGMTTAVMQLVERGAIDLDAPVQRYLPEWRGHNKDRVTIRHLLTHSSGLPPYRQLWREAPSADSAMRIIFATPLDTVPGARLAYSDIGAILLGKIVERVTGQPLDRYLHERVFAPLGMAETMFRPDVALLPRIAPTEFDPWRGRHVRGEVHDENAFFLGGVSAHAGLFSTARDLSRFATMYLSGGALDGARILQPATIARFTRAQEPEFSNRALGWETPTDRNSAGLRLSRSAFGHTGFTGTSIWMDPAQDLFVILLTNRVNPSRENRRIFDVRRQVAEAAAALRSGTLATAPAANAPATSP